MARRDEAAQLTEAAPGDVNIKSGSTFWDWLSEDHPRLKAFLIVGIVILSVWLLFSYNSGYSIAAFLALFLSLGLGFFLFRNEFFFNDSVVLIAFGKDDITLCSVYVIGKEKFRELDREGMTQVFTSESGDPIYIADSFDGKTISYPWSYETSRLRFVLEAASFDELRKDAEQAFRESDRLKSLMKILGIQEGREIVSRYEYNLDRLTKGLPPEDPEEAPPEDSGGGPSE